MTLKIAPPDAKERTYWVGTYESCPIQHLTILGVCLPRFTTVRQKTKLHGLDMDRPVGTIPGGIVHMTAEKYEQVQKRIAESVIRWQGEPNDFCSYGRRGDVLWAGETRVREKEILTETGEVRRTTERAVNYRAQPQDYPLMGDKDHGPGVFLKLVEKPADAPPFFMSDPSTFTPSGGAQPVADLDAKPGNELGKVLKKPASAPARAEATR